MKGIVEYLSTVEDKRQERKVRHKMDDIIALVYFATIANADDYVEIEAFGQVPFHIGTPPLPHCREDMPDPGRFQKRLLCLG